MPNKNPHKKLKWEQEYRNSERGYLVCLHADMYKKRKRMNRKPIECSITKKEFFEQWMLHKEKMGGIFCEYTGLPMTHINNYKKKEKKDTSANISIDRLDNSKPYTIENIVFCRNDFNNRKNQILIEDCKKILKVYEERKRK
jgi:hypothetical protein